MIVALSVKDITEQIPLEVHCRLSSDKIEQLSDSEETPLQGQSELYTVKSVKIEPRAISKYHSFILPPDKSRPPKSWLECHIHHVPWCHFFIHRKTQKHAFFSMHFWYVLSVFVFLVCSISRTPVRNLFHLKKDYISI